MTKSNKSFSIKMITVFLFAAVASAYFFMPGGQPKHLNTSMIINAVGGNYQDTTCFDNMDSAEAPESDEFAKYKDCFHSKNERIRFGGAMSDGQVMSVAHIFESSSIPCDHQTLIEMYGLKPNQKIQMIDDGYMISDLPGRRVPAGGRNREVRVNYVCQKKTPTKFLMMAFVKEYMQ